VYVPSLIIITREGSRRQHVTAIVYTCLVPAARLCLMCEWKGTHSHLCRPVRNVCKNTERNIH